MSGARFTLTIEGDVDTLLAVARAIAPVVAQGGDVHMRTDAPGPRPQLQPIDGGPTRPPARAGVCTGGHGEMRMIQGGTARSGPRMGQPYPPFYKCDTCGERQELK